MNKKGFTLVEIMIVVVVIALLAAIAIPNYMNARAIAAQNVCVANLRQLDSAIQMNYIENGSWPTQFSDLSPYLRNVPTTCPANGAALILRFNYSLCPNHGTLASIIGVGGGGCARLIRFY